MSERGSQREAGGLRRRHVLVAVSVERPVPGPAGHGEGVAAELVAVRLAVVIPLKLSDMPSPEDSDALVRVKLALLLAMTMPVPAGADSDPVPVQPLTVKVLLVALTPVSAATLMPLRLSVKLATGAGQLASGQRIARRNRFDHDCRRRRCRTTCWCPTRP